MVPFILSLLYRIGFAGLLVISFLIISGTSYSFAKDKPKPIVWATYGLTSTGYAQSLVLKDMLETSLGVSITVQPEQNGLGRQTSLKNKRADYCFCGTPGFFAQEGLSDYGLPEWGPQPLRTVMMAKASTGLGVATAKTARIRTLKDLKGRKIAWIDNSDEANISMMGLLKFAGLTKNQVNWVEFPSLKEATEAIVGNKIDGAFMPTSSPYAQKIANSKRGLFWPSLPQSDQKAWWRLKSESPYLTTSSQHTGVELSGWQGASTPFPILMTLSDKNIEQVYLLTRTLVENFDQFQGKAKGIDGWNMAAQNLSWVIPYHEGAIKYYREIGFWNDAHDAHNDNLILRQKILSLAWSDYLSSDPEEDAFVEGWSKARLEALDFAGLTYQLN